jgi:hypothetical protein
MIVDEIQTSLLPFDTSDLDSFQCDICKPNRNRIQKKTAPGFHAVCRMLTY